MEREMFYNTIYHLTEEGVRRRTRIFIDALRE